MCGPEKQFGITSITCKTDKTNNDALYVNSFVHVLEAGDEMINQAKPIVRTHLHCTELLISVLVGVVMAKYNSNAGK